MFTKMKVKKYLNQKEHWTLYEEVLHFYASMHMKEVLRFWGLTSICMSIEWEHDAPVSLSVDSKYHSVPFCLRFGTDDCSCAANHKNKTYKHMNYSDFENINDLFEKIRDLLPN